MVTVELATIGAKMSEMPEHFAITPTNESCPEITRIVDRHYALVCIRPECDITDRTRTQSLFIIDVLGDECAIFVKHLNSIIAAITYIHQPVIRQTNAVH